MKWKLNNGYLREEANAEVLDGGGGGTPVVPAAPVVPATPATPVYFNPDGTFADNWHAGLGDEFSPHAAQLATFKDVKGLAKSLIHFRANGPAYPGEGASAEDVTRYHALARVPAEGTPTGYGVTLPEGASDLDKSVMDRVSKVAHASHMSAPAFQAVVAEYQAIQQEEQLKFEDAAKAQQKASQDALVAEWRGNFEANKSTVRHLSGTLAAQAGIDPASPELAAMLDNPAFARVMLEVSKLTKEDSIGTPAGLGDLRSAQQRADAIMDGTDPIWGAKYRSGNSEDQVNAYNEVKRLLGSAKQ